MKIQKLLGVFLSFFSQAIAISHIISPLPTPRAEVLDIYPAECNILCLNGLYERGLLFSFVSKFDSRIMDEDLRSKLTQVLNDLDLFMPDGFFAQIHGDKNIKIAMLVPKSVVGRYSGIGISTILAYLTSRSIPFVFEVFDSRDEDPQNLAQAYEQIRKKRFDSVVAMLTSEGAENLISYVPISLPTYIPTVNKNQIRLPHIPPKLFLGGIDYVQQMSLLSLIAGGEEVVQYDDPSAIGRSLSMISSEQNFNVIFRQDITTQRAARFSQEAKRQEEKLADHIVLLNIPVIKTGLILPQISFLSHRPFMFLSTQINYNPSLLILLKPRDRKNFYVVNAISNTNDFLIEYALLLGSDLKYDWVSYSIGIGVEMLFLSRVDNVSKFFSETFKDNQVRYENRIFGIIGNSFGEVNIDTLLDNLKNLRESHKKDSLLNSDGF